MGRRSPDPHVAIMEAAKAGRGLRLSAHEVWLLSCDDAIETRAQAVRDGTASWDHLPKGARP